jgi:hypothetical protein
MQALLLERGISTSHITIMTDYNLLGLVSNESANRSAAPSRSSPQLPLVNRMYTTDGCKFRLHIGEWEEGAAQAGNKSISAA